MATQQEQAARLALVLEQQKKTATEISGLQAKMDLLTAKVAELQAVIDADDEASDELIAAVTAVAEQAQIVDESIPDAPPVG